MSTTTIEMPTVPQAGTAPVIETAQTVIENPAPAGTIETMIREASQKYGVDERLALAIARCESSLRQYDKDGHVVRGKVNPKDVGIFQINETFHLSTSQKMGLDIYNTRGNIEYGISLIKRAGSKPWVYSKACWGEVAYAN